MARLELFLLGPPRLQRDGVPLQFDRRKVMALAAYLAMSSLEAEGRHLSRDTLVTLFSPDLEPSRARAAFRRNLSLLRRALEGEWLVADRKRVGTDPEADFWLDVEQFNRLVHSCETHGHPREEVCPRCLEALAEAAALHQGEFLEGFGLRDSVEFDDWQFFQAEELRQQLASVLERLARGHGVEGNHEAALPYARRWLALDPLHEPAHRQLMELYAAAGQRSAALRQYTECVRILDEELGLAPAEETTALYEEIRTMPPAEAAVALGLAEPMELPIRRASLRHNLPAQTTPFVGREKELVQIRQCLAEHRLVTLTGAGGIGKTRMAIQAASEVVAEVPQGAWLAELGPVADPRLVPRVVAAVWDVREEQGRPLQVTLADYLREKTLLLVLDNCEHVIDASSQLAGTLLQRCSGLRILATSREALGVEGEFVVRVPSLSLPPAGPASRATLEGSEAVRLFVSRTATALPGFELTDANAAAVAQVCRRLDGVALALELAAARVRTLRVEQIAARLDDAFHLLTGGSRTVLPHQQTLRATIDWSHALLSDAERACFRRLAVFSGGWTLEAAEAVCTGEEVEPSDVLDLLAQLGNKSLVIIDREPGQEARYRLLETIRQYAREELQEAGEQEQSRIQHLEYYCRLAQEVEPKLYGAQQLEGLAQLDAEQGNLRAALEWGLENRLEAGAQLAGAMFWNWHLRGILADGYAWLQRALAMTSGGSKALRALLLSRAGHLAHEMRYIHRGVRYFEESIALHRELGEPEGVAYALSELGLLLFFDQADRERGRALWQESLELYQQAGNKWGCRHVFSMLGLAHAMEQPDYSLACWQESLALARELRVPDGIAWALYGLGVHAFLQGDDERAMALFKEELPIAYAIRQPFIILDSLFNMEMIALRQGEFEQAKAFAREALEEEIRKPGLRVSWRLLGLQFAISPWKSEALFFENLALARESGDRLVIAHGLFSLAALAWSLGQLEKAVRLYAAALAASGFAPSLPLERTDFDNTLSGTLIQVDETTFQKAWAEGSAMTVEQAVAYALEGKS
ncbi:MAG: BTAD domain-containing putative transcriptional regulator [Anaerolineae bacterium]|jgi:predicted ATPase/DNA-binding SARP family transcriptional activator